MSEEEQEGLDLGGQEGQEKDTPSPASWRSEFSTDLKSNPGLEKFDNAEKPHEALAKSYLEAQKLIGKKGIIPPDENAGEKEWDDFFNALGRPESPEGYDFNGWEPPEALAEMWDDSIRTEILKTMHKVGLNGKQAREIVDSYAALQGSRYQEMLSEVQGNREDVSSSLKKEWGSAYEAKMETAHEAFRAACNEVGIAPEEVAGMFLPDGGLVGDNVVLTRIFATLGERNHEHAFLGGRSKRTTMTPDEADQAIRELEAHPGFADKDHAEHKAIIARRAALYAQKFPVKDDRG